MEPPVTNCAVRENVNEKISVFSVSSVLFGCGLAALCTTCHLVTTSHRYDRFVIAFAVTS